MLPPGAARCLRASCLAVLVLAVEIATAALPAAPAPSKQYDVQIRYRIDAGRPERLNQYHDFLRYLASVGFKVDPELDDDPGDPFETRLRGTMASVDVA